MNKTDIIKTLYEIAHNEKYTKEERIEQMQEFSEKYGQLH